MADRSEKESRHVDGIERAIRNALAKGDMNDRAFREKVYRSVFAALDKTLASQAGLSEDARTQRREALRATVLRIERELAGQRAQQAARAAAPAEPPRQGSAPAARIEPSLGAPRAEPARQTMAAAEPALAAERDDARVSAASRRSWGGVIALVALLALVGGAGWWVWQSGMVNLPGPATQQAESPPLSEQPARQDVQAGDDASWITIMDPRDPSTVTATGDASARADEEDGAFFLLARSGASGTPVRFSVGEGVMERLSGQRAVLRIQASADEEEGETQISVECDLAGLGDCGRRRFLVGITREDFLIETEIATGSLSGAGEIAINTDIEGEGRPVRIHAISVATVR